MRFPNLSKFGGRPRPRAGGRPVFSCVAGFFIFFLSWLFASSALLSSATWDPASQLNLASEADPGFGLEACRTSFELEEDVPAAEAEPEAEADSFPT